MLRTLEENVLILICSQLGKFSDGEETMEEICQIISEKKIPAPLNATLILARSCSHHTWRLLTLDLSYNWILSCSCDGEGIQLQLPGTRRTITFSFCFSIFLFCSLFPSSVTSCGPTADNVFQALFSCGWSQESGDNGNS